MQPVIAGNFMQTSISFAIADTDAEIAHCYPIMVQLRPKLDQKEFLVRVRRMQNQGFRLAYLAVNSRPVSVAGYRLEERLFLGGLGLYIDDLVTDEACRSSGYGSRLLGWLLEEAKKQGCRMVELDSGVQRAEAHRFYFRERMNIIGYHFARSIETGE
jgi:GNAT superfamily N-acetyltransferase